MIVCGCSGTMGRNQKGAGDRDDPISVQQEVVVRGGSLNGPEVVEPLTWVNDVPFCKVSKAIPWVTLFVTGVSVGRRPLNATG